MSTRTKVTFGYDPDPDMSWLEQWNTPETYKGNEVIVDGVPLSFDDYMRTVGDPDNHAMLEMLVQTLADEDEDWQITDSLGGIDFIFAEDNWTTGTFYHVSQIPARCGYQRELAREAGLPE